MNSIHLFPIFQGARCLYYTCRPLLQVCHERKLCLHVSFIPSGLIDLTDSLLALSNTIRSNIEALETTMDACRELVQKSWFTYIENIDDIEGGAGLIARPATPVPGGARYDVNDMFRTKVAHALTSKTAKRDSLPSTTYIVSYLYSLGVESVVLTLALPL